MRLPILLFIIFFSYSCIRSTSTDNDCANAIIDKKMEAHSEYNKTFHEENYTGTVVACYDDDKEKTEAILYYENGDIYLYENYFKNGQLYLSKPLKCNSINGKLVIYMDNGTRGFEIEYKLGRKDGIGKSFYENGNVHYLTSFRNNKKNGRQIEFSETGDTLQIEFFKDGKLIK